MKCIAMPQVSTYLGLASVPARNQLGEEIVVGGLCDAHLLQIVVAVVDCCDAADRAGDVVQQAFGHVDPGSEAGMDGGEGSPEVV